ncbi:MAG: hypothetical protein RLZZ153_920 [Pseudomonadota bacterium]|jgi:hypothetical protein
MEPDRPSNLENPCKTITLLWPEAILRKLTDEEMAAYRAPFVNAEYRQLMLNLPR